MASEPWFPLASDGAGYDDYEQNNAYRYSDAGKVGPACEHVTHWGNLKTSVPDKFLKCKEGWL